jgi:hypothetical protein
VDTIDAMTDQICQRVPSIPLPIRVFCKALYDTIITGPSPSTVSKHGAYRLISFNLIEQWLAKIAF